MVREAVASRNGPASGTFLLRVVLASVFLSESRRRCRRGRYGHAVSDRPAEAAGTFVTLRDSCDRNSLAAARPARTHNDRPRRKTLLAAANSRSGPDQLVSSSLPRAGFGRNRSAGRPAGEQLEKATCVRASLRDGTVSRLTFP